jgi:hypothetical protein
VNRRCRAGEVVYFVNFDIERECNIVTHQFEVGMVEEMGDICPAASIEVVDTQHIVTVVDQALAQVGAEKTGTTGYKDSFNGIVMAHDFSLNI